MQYNMYTCSHIAYTHVYKHISADEYMYVYTCMGIYTWVYIHGHILALYIWLHISIFVNYVYVPLCICLVDNKFLDQ